MPITDPKFEGFAGKFPGFNAQMGKDPKGVAIGVTQGGSGKKKFRGAKRAATDAQTKPINANQQR